MRGALERRLSPADGAVAEVAIRVTVEVNPRVVGRLLGCGSNTQGVVSRLLGCGSNTQGVVGRLLGCGSNTQGVVSRLLGCGSNTQGVVSRLLGCGSNTQGAVRQEITRLNKLDTMSSTAEMSIIVE